MFKKFITTLSLATLCISSTSLVYANSNPKSITPEFVLPQDLELVLNVDMKQSPQIADLIQTFAEELGEESAMIFANAGARNNIIVGARHYDINEGFEDMFLAVKMTKEEYKAISHAFGASEGLTTQGGVIEYLCYESNEGCFVQLGNYFYLTGGNRAMDEVIRNFQNGERDVLAHNTNYTDSQKAALPHAGMDAYIAFDIVSDEVMEEFKAEPLLQNLADIIESIEYEGFSTTITNDKFAARAYVKHNTKDLKKLSFKYADLIFRPQLYNYVSAENMLMYFESHNLAARFELIKDALKEELGEESEMLFRFFNVLDARNAFAIRYSDTETIPYFTLMGEIKRNNQRKAKEAIRKVVEAIEENDEEVDIKIVKDGLYSISFPLDESTAEEVGATEFTLKFGVHTNGLLIISNDPTAGERHTNANTTFKDNVQGPKNTVGTGYVNFQEIHRYLSQANARHDAGMEEGLEYIQKLNLLTMKAYAKTSSIRMDMTLTYDFKDALEEFFEGLEQELSF